MNCATCHKKEKAFTDQLPVSEGINKLIGTRNAPTVINAAYMHRQFWDGREPSLEEQSGKPFINTIEMGLADHTPILRIVRSDPEYADLFKKAFGRTGEQITMKEVKQAIASFERTIISGNSPSIAEVEELVQPGELDPDHIHLAGVYVHRIFQGSHYEKRIERKTVQIQG